MYIILLLLIVILGFYGYSRIEGMDNKKKDKEKDKNKDKKEPTSIQESTENTESTSSTSLSLCAENHENIETIRTQISEIASLKQQLDTLKKTTNSNDTKISMLLNKVQTMV